VKEPQRHARAASHATNAICQKERFPANRLFAPGIARWHGSTAVELVANQRHWLTIVVAGFSSEMPMMPT